MTKILIGDYAPDTASFDQATTSFVQNVLPNANGYGPMRALGSIGGALPARCLGMFSCLDSDNTAHVFAGTATALYKLDSTTRAWVNVSRSGTAYSLADRECWSFAQFGNNVIAVADGNAPQVFTFGSTLAFGDLGGSPPQARGVTVVGDFLVLFGLTSNPSRIQWSGLNNITHWTVGQQSSDYQDFPDGGYVRGVSGGEFGLVFQDNAIRRMIFNPGPTIFDFSRIADDTGMLMPYSMVASGFSVFFMAHDGFYRLDPSGGLTPIGARKVNKTVLSDLDASNPRNMVGSVDPKRHRICWAYKSSENLNNDVLDRMIVYDWSLDRWGFGACQLQYITQTSPLSTSIESLTGSIDELTVSFDSFVRTPSFELTGVGTNLTAGYFDGPTLEATLDTPEGTLGEGQRMKVQQIAPLSDAPGCMVRAAVRNRLQDAIVFSTEYATSARSGYAGARGTGRFASARIRIPAQTEWSYITGVEVDAVPAGRL